MRTRFIKIQLVVFAIVTVIALVMLFWYYVRVPSLVGIGQYQLSVNLPSSGGLYPTANVTYRGVTIGRVTSVEPTGAGVRATMSIDKQFEIPDDATANVHSVSAVGEQYLDLVSRGNSKNFYVNGQTIATGTVPSEIGPTLDAVNRGLAALPEGKIPALLDETSQAVGGLGPTLQRLVDATQAIVGDFNANIADVRDIIDHASPILDSQVATGEQIGGWSANLNTLAAEAAEQDRPLRNALQQAAPTADQLNAVFGDVREALPQTLANLEIVLDMLKRYHDGLEQGLVFLPQGAAIAQTVTAPFENSAALDFRLSVNSPPPCLTGFLPASQWRSPADTSPAPLPENAYCKIPKDTPSNVVRGARNLPCVDVPGKRAATPMACRSDQPYIPSGTNPWYGTPDQVVACPAPAARCDRPVQPGLVMPAPSVNNGMNPAPAEQLPPPEEPRSDALTPPVSGAVECTGQQPNSCRFEPTSDAAAAIYQPASGEVVGPNGQRYILRNSTVIGDEGWKDMLAPAS